MPAEVDSIGTTTAIKRAKLSLTVPVVDALLVAAVPGKRLRVLSVVMQGGTGNAVVTINSKPAAIGVPLTPNFSLGAGGTQIWPFDLIGWIETAVGEGLSVTQVGAANTGFLVRYIEV